MRPTLLLSLAASAVLAFATPALGQGVGLDIGTPAPAAALEDLEGNAVELADYIEPGKLTLIEFWATWCDLCEALQPQIDQIVTEHGDEVNVVAVAVAVSQSQRRVQRHVDDHGATYPFLWDGSGNAVRAYNAATTSIVIILDGEGAVAYAGVGGDQDLIGAVQEQLGS